MSPPPPTPPTPPQPPHPPHSARALQSPQLAGPGRPITLHTYQVIFYRRALHPELFTLKGRRVVRYGAYELEAWIMAGAHMLRFSHKGLTACELVTSQEDQLPTEGTIVTFPCAGEHEFEHRFHPEPVIYMTTVQTEQLSESLYAATYQEMLDLAAETGAMLHKWDEPPARAGGSGGSSGGGGGGKCLSMLDLQRFSKEIHAQSYHLIAQGGFVLRTQTIFEHR